MADRSGFAVILDGDGCVRVRDGAGGETRVTGRAAVRLRWAVRHAAEVEAWTCPACGSSLGTLQWVERADAPSHYVCPAGHVSLVAAHHAPMGERLN
jgi:hypothetical protein